MSAAPSQGAYDAASGRWAVGSLAAGATAQLVINVTVTAPGSITNLAVKTGQNEPDLNAANDSAGATINAASADVMIEKSADRTDPLVSDSVTFTVTATNRGPDAATAVTVSDALPAGFTFVSAAPSQGTYDSATGMWTIGDVAVSAPATLTIVATVTQAGPLVNNAAVTSQTEVDPNPINNSAAASINASGTADLRVAKAVGQPLPLLARSPASRLPSRTLGPDDAAGATIADVLPAGSRLFRRPRRRNV